MAHRLHTVDCDLSRNDWQHHVRWPFPIGVDGIPSDYSVSMAAHRLARIGVEIKPGKIAAGDIHSNPVASLE